MGHLTIPGSIPAAIPQERGAAAVLKSTRQLTDRSKLLLHMRQPDTWIAPNRAGIRSVIRTILGKTVKYSGKPLEVLLRLQGVDGSANLDIEFRYASVLPLPLSAK